MTPSYKDHEILLSASNEVSYENLIIKMNRVLTSTEILRKASPKIRTMDGTRDVVITMTVRSEYELDMYLEFLSIILPRGTWIESVDSDRIWKKNEEGRS